VNLNGVPCSAKNVKKLKYPLSRFIFLVLPTNGATRWSSGSRTGSGRARSPER
jgi:hypothetical protein